MAKPGHKRRLHEGVIKWNRWRRRYPKVRPDLTDASLAHLRLCRYNFAGARLDRVDFTGADLGGADLTFAYLHDADLSLTNLAGVRLGRADLTNACLRSANLHRASAHSAVLHRADLSESRLDDANLSYANLCLARLDHASLFRTDLTGALLVCASAVDTNFEAATLSKCSIYGLSVWNANFERAEQRDLVITAFDKPQIMSIMSRSRNSSTCS